MRLRIDLLSIYIVVDRIVDRGIDAVALPYRLQGKDVSLPCVIPVVAVRQIIERIRCEMRALSCRIDRAFLRRSQTCNNLPMIKFKFSTQISRNQCGDRHMLIIYRIVTIFSAVIESRHIDDIAGSRRDHISIAVSLIPA